MIGKTMNKLTRLLCVMCAGESSSIMPAKQQHSASPYDVKPSFLLSDLLRTTALNRGPVLEAPHRKNRCCSHSSFLLKIDDNSAFVLLLFFLVLVYMMLKWEWILMEAFCWLMYIYSKGGRYGNGSVWCVNIDGPCCGDKAHSKKKTLRWQSKTCLICLHTLLWIMTYYQLLACWGTILFLSITCPNN